MRYVVLLIVAISLGWMVESFAKGYDGAYGGSGEVGVPSQAPRLGDRWGQKEAVDLIDVGLNSEFPGVQKAAVRAAKELLNYISGYDE